MKEHKPEFISLLPIEKIDPLVIDHILMILGSRFPMPTRVLQAQDLSRELSEILQDGRLNSTALLLYMCKHAPGKNTKLLAVTGRDLYSPIFSHLYGEAQLGGTCALMSLYRLRPEFHHDPPDRDLFLSRCEKEALHELGHTFNLSHCRDQNCVMYPSSTMIDTDTKAAAFCTRCLKAIRR